MLRVPPWALPRHRPGVDITVQAPGCGDSPVPLSSPANSYESLIHSTRSLIILHVGSDIGTKDKWKPIKSEASNTLAPGNTSSGDTPSQLSSTVHGIWPTPFPLMSPQHEGNHSAAVLHPRPITCSVACKENEEIAQRDREMSSLTLLLMAVHASNAGG